MPLPLRSALVVPSPHRPDQFLLAATDLRLYEYKETFLDGRTVPINLNVAETSATRLLCANQVTAELAAKPCVDWYRDGSVPPIAAVALASGDVILSSFDAEGAGSATVSQMLIESAARAMGSLSAASAEWSADTGVRKSRSNDSLQLAEPQSEELGIVDDHVLGTLVMKPSRATQALAFNTVHYPLLACGLEKHRTEPSLLVWDISRAKLGGGGLRRRRTLPRSLSNDTLPELSNACTEISSADAVTSLQWVPSHAHNILAGMGGRYLRVYDIRDASKAVAVTATKAVHNIAFDSHNAHIFASHSEQDSVVKIWDMRKMVEPILGLGDVRPLLQMAWCPSRAGYLAVLPRGAREMSIYDLQWAGTDTAAADSSPVPRPAQTLGLVRSRTVSLTREGPIATFCWHPTQTARLLAVGYEGYAEDMSVSEPVALAWSPDERLVFVERNAARVEQPVPLDIVRTIHRRAAAGYNLDTARNLELCEGDRQLEALWSWMHDINKQWTLIRAGVKSMYQGVAAALASPAQGETESVRSSHTHAGGLHFFPTYRSAARATALQLCGWNFGSINNPIEPYLQQLEASGQHEKAASIAIFHCNLTRALVSLQEKARALGARDTETQLQIMALAGYSDDRRGLWAEWCRPLVQNIKDAYLRAAFAFLTSDGPPFSNVLGADDLPLYDKIGIACRFLPDDELRGFVRSTIQDYIRRGDLEAIVLTGLTTKEAADLLQRYVEVTGDVQSVALCVALAYPQYVYDANDPRFKAWIETYRDLLDRWQMWQLRAEFDVARNQRISGNVVPPQILVRCNFCSQSVTRSESKDMRSRSRVYTNDATTAGKFTACPACRKPLPKCALCLIPLGTSSTSEQNKDDTKITNPLSTWFAWCQTCRHGGHTDHMADWFLTHDDCPVAGCDCLCQLRG